MCSFCFRVVALTLVKLTGLLERQKAQIILIKLHYIWRIKFLAICFNMHIYALFVFPQGGPDEDYSNEV